MDNLSTPILLIIFNRLEYTKQVFEIIKQESPSHLFIAADGARLDVSDENEKCKAVREYVLSNVDWECEVKTLFRDVNLGCGLAPAAAISWFFEHVEEGIILEDDCVPHPDFFGYCKELLQKYKNDNSIAVIGGDNFQEGQVRGNASYYFSKYSYTWGWATWRRVWQGYQFDLRKIDKTVMWLKINATFKTQTERSYWKSIFETISISHGEAWDYQLWFHVWYNGMYSIAPNVNLVKNIGFGENATHTHDSDSKQAFLDTQSILPLVHPVFTKIDDEADLYYFRNYWFGHSEQTLFSRFISKLYTCISPKLILGYRKVKKALIRKK